MSDLTGPHGWCLIHHEADTLSKVLDHPEGQILPRGICHRVTLSHNGEAGYQRRWFVLGESPAELGIDPDDHTRPVISVLGFNKDAIVSAIKNDTWKARRLS